MLAIGMDGIEVLGRYHDGSLDKDCLEVEEGLKGCVLERV